MRKLSIILGIITSVLALILAVTPLSNIAFIPAVAALTFGIFALYLSRQKQESKKTVHLIFLMTIIALVLTTYKAVFNTTEVNETSTEQLEQKQDQLEEESLDELDDLEID